MSWNFWCNMATQNLIEGWSSLIQLSHFPTVFFYLAEVTSLSHDFTRPPFWIHVRFYLHATPSIFPFVPIGKGILPCYYAAGKIRWLCLLRDCFVEIAGLVWGNKNMSSLLELNLFFFLPWLSHFRWRLGSSMLLFHTWILAFNHLRNAARNMKQHFLLTQVTAFVQFVRQASKSFKLWLWVGNGKMVAGL